MLILHFDLGKFYIYFFLEITIYSLRFEVNFCCIKANQFFGS